MHFYFVVEYGFLTFVCAVKLCQQLLRLRVNNSSCYMHLVVTSPLSYLVSVFSTDSVTITCRLALITNSYLHTKDRLLV